MAQALLELAKYHGPWKGTLTQFLELIGEWTGYAAVTTAGWPKTPSRAAIELRELPLNCACSVYPSPSSEARGRVESLLSRQLVRATGPEHTWGSDGKDGNDGLAR